MKKITLSTFPIILMAFSILSGCSTVYWEKNWQYEGTTKSDSDRQRLTVASTPPARLLINGEDMGETPLLLQLPYSVTTVRASKRQLEESFGGAQNTLDTKWKTEHIIHKEPNIFHFQATGYHDLFLPVVIPHTSDKLNVSLKKAGIINNIDCTIRIEARKEYLPDLKAVIQRFAVAGRVTTLNESPHQLEGQNVYRLVSNLIVKDSISFDGLVTALLEEAEAKRFVFDILDAKTEATFSTNVMDMGVEHVVKGKVRAGATLFLIRDGKSYPVSSVDQDGRFAFRIRISPNNSHVYLVSRYKKILFVYKKVDVFKQVEEELSLSDFAKEVGLEETELKRLVEWVD